jgi:pantoate--beta-alanine ligase
VQVVSAPADMRSRAREARSAGRRIGLVPTMGFLHAGHLALVAEARRRSDLVAMSVFVNPLQFAPGEDFSRYPRDLDRDHRLAASAGVDVLWTPRTDEMYPRPPLVTVSPGPMGERLEGAIRPGHFAGVLTVVLKLFAVAEPDVAVFGRKDFQQAALIRRMAADLDLPVDIVVAPTVRGGDGLALSSRNLYLGGPERARATALPRALGRGVEVFRAGERRAAAISAAARGVLEDSGGVAIDYVECVGPEECEPVQLTDERSVLVLAARIDGTRLIDNVVLGRGLEGDGRADG